MSLHEYILSSISEMRSTPVQLSVGRNWRPQTHVIYMPEPPSESFLCKDCVVQTRLPTLQTNEDLDPYESQWKPS